MRVADVFAALRLDTSEFQKGLQNLNQEVNTSAKQWGRSMTRFGRNTQQLGRSMTTSLTLPILAAGAATSKLALDFDTTMRRIVGLTDVTADQVGRIREEILKLGPEVGKSPRELAEAFYFVASAGFAAQEAMDVLETAARASAAGLGNTQTVAQVLGSVINAYGKENITAARAADILVEAVSQGTAEADQFAGSLGRVVPVAAGLGVSFDQVTAALAAMTLSGLSVDEATTSLRQVMVSLLKPTVQAEEAMGELGLSSEGLRRQLREEGLLATLQTLQERFAGNETATSAVFGNVRALVGIQNLLGLETEQLNAIFGKTADSVGRLGEGYEATEGPGRDLARAMADLEAVAIDLGDDVLPTVVDIARDVADAARGVASAWRGLSDETQQSIIQWALWLAIAGPVLTIVGKLASAAGALLKGVAFLTGAKGIPRLIGALKGMRLATLAVLGPFGLLAAAAFAFQEPISDLINDLSGISKSLQNFAKSVGVPASHVKRALHELSDDLGISLGLARDRVQDFMEATGASFSAAVDAVRNNEDELRANLQTWNELYEDGLSGVTSTIEDGNRDAADAMGDLPPALAASLVDGEFVVEEAATDVIEDPVADALAAAIANAGQAGREIIDSFTTGLFEKKDDLETALEEFVDSVTQPYPELSRRADIEAVLASQAIADGLRSEDPRVQAETLEFVNDLLDQYETMAPGALAAGELVNPSLEAGIRTNLASTLQFVQDEVTGEIGNSLEFADVAQEAGLEGISAYARGIFDEKKMAGLAAQAVRQEAAREMGADVSVFRQAGFTHGGTYAEGLGDQRNRRASGTAGRHLAYAARDGVNFSLHWVGLNVGRSFGDGLKAAQNYITTVAGDIRRSVGGHLQFAGSPPYTKSREYGAGVAQSWIGALLDEFRQGIPALVSGMTSVGGALQPAFAGALPSMAAPSVASPLPGAEPKAGNTYQWILHAGGVEKVFHSRDDFIKALDDMSAFGDGRVD